MREGGGILEIIIPSGYLTNPSPRYKNIRKYLFSNFRIIANISLPENVFKLSGAGGNTNILIVKKEKRKKNYRIFVDSAKKIGFEYDKAKKGGKIFKKNLYTGEKLKDKENKLLVDNDLVEIEKKFKQFIFDNVINGFETENSGISYNVTTINEIWKDNSLIFCPKRFIKSYKTIISKIKKGKFETLKSIKAQVQNNKSFEKDKSIEYIYLDTSEVFGGVYKKSNILRGWQLPNRAKQSIKKYDILIAKLRGSIGKFCMILEDNEKLVVSNGFWRIRIENEKQRLNFYSYLFTKECEKQLETLSTGTIMDDIKHSDMVENLLISTNNEEENYIKMKKLIEIQETLIKISE